jgi:hypothetical protein
MGETKNEQKRISVQRRGCASPAKERSKTFFIGRDFDPVKVGVDGSVGKVPVRHLAVRQLQYRTFF